ncbi:hypothetical protein EYF80_043192 [Liparis tanakae]|uniref:Uncharacterized protein n=1 Tax=Liparis tanakae TaxID=230148 RepID=A0A4Z2G0H0_9TELE|nr:hypothetical protein EYF80_043192 [Liparis tanakae]
MHADARRRDECCGADLSGLKGSDLSLNAENHSRTSARSESTAAESWEMLMAGSFPYLAVCSSGGAPATSVLGSEVVLSTVTPPDDPGDPAGDAAAVWGQNSPIAPTNHNLSFELWDMNDFIFISKYPKVFLVADRAHAVGAGVTIESASQSAKHWHLRLIGLLSHAPGDDLLIVAVMEVCQTGPFLKSTSETPVQDT